MVANQSVLVTSVSTRSAWAIGRVPSPVGRDVVRHDPHRADRPGHHLGEERARPWMSTAGAVGVPSCACSSGRGLALRPLLGVPVAEIEPTAEQEQHQQHDQQRAGR